MRRDLVDVTELFKYLMSGYSLELEKVETQNGIQRRLNDIELEYELKEMEDGTYREKSVINDEWLTIYRNIPVI